MQLFQLSVSGNDCHDFLQRQLTADIAAIEPEQTVLTAWCNIQGRVMSLIWLQKLETGALLHVPASSYALLMPKLKMFVMRDDVLFSEAEACFGSIIEGQLQPCSEAQVGWQSGLIQQGIPYLETEACEAYLPQMLNLDLLDGLSFKKGCYPGQEIIARTHFRGKLKQRCLRFSSTAKAGDELFNKEQIKAAKVILSDSQQCLAVVRLENLGNGLFDAQGNSAELLTLPYQIPELT